MPWIRFTEDHPDHPSPPVTRWYRAGEVALVSDSCAKAAADKGRGKHASKAEIDKARAARKAAGLTDDERQHQAEVPAAPAAEKPADA